MPTTKYITTAVARGGGGEESGIDLICAVISDVVHSVGDMPVVGVGACRPCRLGLKALTD